MNHADYRPAPGVLERVRQVDFVAIVGPTAVGKTTLIKAAVAQDPRLHMMIAGTSRPIRPGEQDGVDFHFGDRAGMAERAAQGGYVTAVGGATGDLYTTAPEDYPPDKTVLMAVMAHAMPLFRSLPWRSFRSIFVVPESERAWQTQLGQHGFDPAQLEKHLQEGKISLEFARGDRDTLFVVNHIIPVAADDLVTLALGRPLPERQQRDQTRARDIVQDLLDALASRVM